MAEKVKKVRRAETPKSKAVKTKDVVEKVKPSIKKAKPAIEQVKPSREQIAQLAHKYWAERGWQHGAADHDWLRAEQELMGIAS